MYFSELTNIFQWQRYLKKAGPGDYYTENKELVLCDLLTTSNIDTSKCDEILGKEKVRKREIDIVEVK